MSMISTLLKNVLGGLVLILAATSANATLEEIQFTASGSATGSGQAIVDSSLLTSNTETCCELPPSTFKSLNLDLNFGQGVTVFDLANLSGTSFVINVNSNGVLQDLNFWGTNAAGVTLEGVSEFTDAASGALGANGEVFYTVTSVGAVVPEPANVALFGLGLFAFAFARRRKQ
jgi:hypothetical protein